jgi:polar amino acid transport system substrate-binding protein
MKKGIILFIVSLISVSFFMVSCSKDKTAVKKIVVATDATWPPMEYVDENKKIVGFDIDYLTAAAKEAGFEVNSRIQHGMEFLQDLLQINMMQYAPL